MGVPNQKILRDIKKSYEMFIWELVFIECHLFYNDIPHCHQATELVDCQIT